MNYENFDSFDWEEIFNEMKNNKVSDELFKNVTDYLIGIDYNCKNCTHDVSWNFVNIIDENSEICGHILGFVWFNEQRKKLCEINIYEKYFEISNGNISKYGGKEIEVFSLNEFDDFFKKTINYLE